MEDLLALEELLLHQAVLLNEGGLQVANAGNQAEVATR